MLKKSLLLDQSFEYCTHTAKLPFIKACLPTAIHSHFLLYSMRVSAVFVSFMCMQCKTTFPILYLLKNYFFQIAFYL